MRLVTYGQHSHATIEMGLPKTVSTKHTSKMFHFDLERGNKPAMISLLYIYLFILICMLAS